MTPWWAILNFFVGFVLFVWILTPALYYTDVSKYLSLSVNPALTPIVLAYVLLPHIW